MVLKLTPFDASRYLETDEDFAELLSDAFASGDSGYVSHAFGVIAKAKGMSQIARDAGVSREALYKSLNENGDPKLSTLLGVARALGLRLHASVEGAQPDDKVA